MVGNSRHRCGLRFVVACVLAALPAMPVARAGETGKPAADAAKAAALAHFEAAKRLFDVREYGRALEEYKEAYLAKPDPAFLVNIGLCHRKLGQNAQAIDFYQQFLKKAPLDDPNRRQIEARIADIQADEQEKAARAATVKAEPTPPAATAVGAAEAEAAAAPPAAPPTVPVTGAGEGASPSPPPAGIDLSVAAPAEPLPTTKPIHETWWFWTGVGAVVVGGAVTTALLMRSGGGTAVPTTTLGNRPVFP